jgi:hypothetical protein
MDIMVMSKVYSEDYENETWSASPTTQLLRQLHAQGETARWIAAITTPTDEVMRIALGDPVRDNFSSCLYVPPWFCLHAGLIGDGQDRHVSVRFEKCEDLPRATELVMQVLGDVPEDFSIRDVLEDPLSQLGVLQEDMILPIPFLNANLRVKATKPAACVFLDGQNIALCFEEPAAQPKEVKNRTATPMPTPIFAASFEDFNAPMVPFMNLNSTRLNTSQPRTSSNTRSIYFGGIGRRLHNS